MKICKANMLHITKFYMSNIRLKLNIPTWQRNRIFWILITKPGYRYSFSYGYIKLSVNFVSKQQCDNDRNHQNTKTKMGCIVIDTCPVEILKRILCHHQYSYCQWRTKPTEKIILCKCKISIYKNKLYKNTNTHTTSKDNYTFAKMLELVTIFTKQCCYLEVGYQLFPATQAIAFFHCHLYCHLLSPFVITTNSGC